MNRFKNNWGIYNSNNIEIGELSRTALKTLEEKNIKLREFQFQDGEVIVKNVYRHLNVDEISGDILEEWYVVIPQIRVCR